MRICLAIALLLFAGFAMGSTFTVVPGQSLQADIDAASKGDPIYVQNGTYYESVNVTKQLDLRDIDHLELDVGGKESAIRLLAEGISLQGFIIQNAIRAGILAKSNEPGLPEVSA